MRWSFTRTARSRWKGRIFLTVLMSSKI